MKLYSISLSPEYSWLMYSGSEPMFGLLLAVLREEVPGLGELTVVPRHDGPGAAGLHLNLLTLPPGQYRAALRVLADQAVLRARKELYGGELSSAYERRGGSADGRIEALGDMKTVALIARNVLARMAEDVAESGDGKGVT
ncbi:hypothetical protein [Nonomuraea rhodomycinica]|uniref:Uncharacterized protein n=1 Tax=Nonomuraea rhodomycinica TaxID=1712872 RepID=A0A7Y6INQ5_9ACTN|nr:hypothetical protein [Nonomuraea rhodomycinica]NUW41245.1 hypothetical protein [Nonomuraea rhodomycinica]